MHRFGRPAQQKMKDRWGGSFILATILALVGAAIAGNKLSEWYGNRSATGNVPGYNTEIGGLGGDSPSHTVNMNVEPQQFQVSMIQVAAVRSEASAKTLSKDLNDKGYTGMVGAKTSAGLYPVMVGVYTQKAAADEAKAKLVAEGMNTAFVSPKTVDYNTGVVPAAAMGNKAADIKKGIDTMNMYLHEVALYIENRAAGKVDSKNIVDHGKQLGDMALTMKDATDAKMKQFTDLATKASVNAMAMEKAMTADPNSAEFQTAMSGYLTLLDGYRTFQSGK